MTVLTGIFQGDVIIRSAIVQAIADVRANPWLLDFVFVSLTQDDLTKNQYGQKEVDQARKWFLSTNIPVIMSGTVDKPTFPCLTVTLNESNETEQTLSDTHYQPEEDEDSLFPVLAGPFTPSDYVVSTGWMTVDEDDIGDVILGAGMVVVDKSGVEHEILEVSDSNIFRIHENTVADFTGATIRGQRPARVMTLESSLFREVYSIGVHVSGERAHLMYLHSLVVFMLLRYRQTLLEARGFERATISSGPPQKNDFFDPAIVFTRNIQISGFLRQSWPKLLSNKITATEVELRAEVDDSSLDLEADSLGSGQILFGGSRSVPL